RCYYRLRRLREALVDAEGRLDVAHHGDQARPQVLLELALPGAERRDGAVEGDDLAVHGAAHGRADGRHLAAQLAHGDAEPAQADVLERLVDRRTEPAVGLGLLHLDLVQHR